MHLLAHMRAVATLLLSLLLLSPALVMPTGSGAWAQDTQRIAAIVNDDIVSTADLGERIELARLFSGLPNDQATRRRLAPQVLRRVIDEHLQMQEAKRLKLVAGDSDVDSAISRLAGSNNLSADQLSEILKRANIPPERLRSQVQAELSWVRVVRRTLAPKVVVTDQQIDLALDAQAGAGETELLLSEIVLPVYDPGQEGEVVAQARELMASVREGADFAKLARQVSVAASVESGGDLGWTALTSIPAALRSAIEPLQPGQLSDPLRSPAGVHLYLVRDRRIGRGVRGDPDALQLAQLYFPLAANAAPEQLADTISQARALRPTLSNCADIVATADEQRLPSSGDLGWLRPADLPPDLAAVIAALPTGEVSEPLRSSTGVHLLMVCAKGGDSDNEALRSQSRKKLEDEQVNRLAARYLRDLRKDAFIDVRVRL